MCQRFILVTEPEYQRLTQNSAGDIDITEPVPVSDPKQQAQVLEILPAKLKNSAVPLLAAFQQRYPTELTWDSKTGEITVKGQKISNSNIADIIRYLLLPWQKSRVRGATEIIKLLKETNFPALLIKNSKVRQVLDLDTIPESQETPDANQESDKQDSNKQNTDKARVWLRWK